MAEAGSFAPYTGYGETVRGRQMVHRLRAKRAPDKTRRVMTVSIAEIRGTPRGSLSVAQRIGDVAASSRALSNPWIWRNGAVSRFSHSAAIFQMLGKSDDKA